MKYALVQGQHREAQPGLFGECPACGSVMTPKCGQLKIWHWAHRSIRHCDPWWENETSWHRRWKNQFPSDWQEKVHKAENGEKHVADVRTNSGVVLEFQHSPLPLNERTAREAFYPKMVWVVRASTRDAAKLSQGIVMRIGQPQIYVVRSDTCALLRAWAGSGVPVYFDFGDGDPNLWRLTPERSNGMAYLLPVGKASFVAEYLAGETLERTCAAYIEKTLSNLTRTLWPQPLSKFERHLARKERARPRF
jgi:competence protein CoiA